MTDVTFEEVLDAYDNKGENGCVLAGIELSADESKAVLAYTLREALISSLN